MQSFSQIMEDGDSSEEDEELGFSTINRTGIEIIPKFDRYFLMVFLLEAAKNGIQKVAVDTVL